MVSYINKKLAFTSQKRENERNIKKTQWMSLVLVSRDSLPIHIPIDSAYAMDAIDSKFPIRTILILDTFGGYWI